MSDVINRLFVDRDRAALIWIPLTVVGIFAAKGFAAYYQDVNLARAGNRIVADAQRRLYDHVLNMDVAFFQQHPSADLITRLTYNATSVRDIINLILLGIGRDLLTLLGLIVVMVTQDPILAAIALLGGPICAIGVKRLIVVIRKAASSEITSTMTIVALMRETTQGIRIAKSFQLEDILRERMYDAVASVERLSNKVKKVQASVAPLIELLGGIAIALVITYAGWRTLSYGDTPGQFFSFIAALLLAADPARRLARVPLDLATAAIGVRMVHQLMDAPAAEQEHDDDKPKLFVGAGEMRFIDVLFSYVPGTPVLNGLSIDIAGGQTNALVGISLVAGRQLSSISCNASGPHRKESSRSTVSPLQTYHFDRYVGKLRLLVRTYFYSRGPFAITSRQDCWPPTRWSSKWHGPHMRTHSFENCLWDMTHRLVNWDPGSRVDNASAFR